MKWQDIVAESGEAGVALDPKLFDEADLRDLLLEHGLVRSELILRRKGERLDQADFIRSGLEGGERAEGTSDAGMIRYLASLVQTHAHFASQCAREAESMSAELEQLRRRVDLVTKLPDRFRACGEEIAETLGTTHAAQSFADGRAEGWKRAAQALESELLVDVITGEVASKLGLERKPKP